tara:strand:- start:3218 stop:4996 length:1779 start_codon:yes stop_codon:yes gene_type:complete
MNVWRDWKTFQENTEYSDVENPFDPGSKGDSIKDPFFWINEYFWSVWHDMKGTKTTDVGPARHGGSNELLELFSQFGGELTTKVGLDPESISKVRLEALRHGRNEIGVFDRVSELAHNPIDLARQLVTISDVGPRLAEFAGVLRSYGYVYDRESGRILNTDPDVSDFQRPPRHVMIEAINAAADVTINYKKRGAKAVVMGKFFPFFEAYLEGINKKYRVWSGAYDDVKGNVKKGDYKEALANRVLITNMLTAGATIAYWMYRRGDDDYREEEQWLRSSYWTLTYDGAPIFRLSKGFEESIVPNIVEGILNSMDPQAEVGLADFMYEEAKKLIPRREVALATPLIETWGNYDFFKGKDIETYSMQQLSPKHRYTPYTSEVSKWVGQYTGQAIGIGPAKLDHLLNGLSGGAWRRLTGTGERVYKAVAKQDIRYIRAKELPFVTGYHVPREYPASVGEFYRHRDDKQKEYADAVRIEKRPKRELRALKKRVDDLNTISDVLTSLWAKTREAEHRAEKFETQRYVIGLTRLIMGKEPLERYPNPLRGRMPSSFRRALIDTWKGKGYSLTSGRFEDRLTRLRTLSRRLEREGRNKRR